MQLHPGRGDPARAGLAPQAAVRGRRGVPRTSGKLGALPGRCTGLCPACVRGLSSPGAMRPPPDTNSPDGGSVPDSKDVWAHGPARGPLRAHTHKSKRPGARTGHDTRVSHRLARWTARAARVCTARHAEPRGATRTHSAALQETRSVSAPLGGRGTPGHVRGEGG